MRKLNIDSILAAMALVVIILAVCACGPKSGYERIPLAKDGSASMEAAKNGEPALGWGG